MKKNKRTLKGFTLIELIIVLAIFSIIMTLVMSFIDPVSKLMKKTSLKERTISYVDNIGEYVDNSLRYAKFVQICDRDYFAIGDSDNRLDNPPIAAADERHNKTEKAAVEKFVDTFFNSARDASGNLLEGEVHVLQFINDDEAGLDSGMIYESRYHFRAGDPRDTTLGHAEYKTVSVSSDAAYGGYIDRPVVNQEHISNYDFYYKLGFWSLQAINDTENYFDTVTGDELSPEAGSYYSRLVRMDASTGNIGPLPTDISIGYVPINIISYGNDGANMLKVDHTVGAATETIPVFKSPAAMNTVSLSLINAINAADPNNSNLAAYYKFKYEMSGGSEVPKKDDSGNNVYDAVALSSLPVFSYNYAKFSTSENFFIIYVLPYEVYDSMMVLKD